MNKGTKFCELHIYMGLGVRIVGNFHVDIGTSSTVRPSDALRQHEHPFLVLTDATVTHGNNSHRRDTVMIRLDAISYVELPHKGWKTSGTIIAEVCGMMPR
jgi:hypothetical protein